MQIGWWARSPFSFFASHNCFEKWHLAITKANVIPYGTQRKFIDGMSKCCYNSFATMNSRICSLQLHFYTTFRPRCFGFNCWPFAERVGRYIFQVNIFNIIGSWLCRAAGGRVVLCSERFIWKLPRLYKELAALFELAFLSDSNQHDNHPQPSPI